MRSNFLRYRDIYNKKNMALLTYDKFVNYKKIKDICNLINDSQKKQIMILSRYYTTETIKNRLDSLRQFILCGVDKNWLSRLKIIKEKLKTDVISEYSCKIRYGDMWEIKRNEIKNKVKIDEAKFVSKYGQQEGLKKWEEHKLKLRSYGKEIMIEKYGEEEGLKKWESALQSKINTMAKRKLINPYRNGRTLVEYQNRYGVKEGYIKWKRRNENQSYRFSIDYFKNEYKDNWAQKWEEYKESMSKTSLESFVLRYGEIIGKMKYDECVFKAIQNLRLKPIYSKISQELFFKICGSLESLDNVFFAENNGEYIFYPSKEDCIYGIFKLIQVDFKFGNKIIEFDGDYWHSKKEQIEKDILRDKFLIEKGYSIKRIKECDYRNNEDKIVKECVEFLKN